MVGRKLKLGDFLAPPVRQPVRMAIYNWLWYYAGQDVSYETLGRAAWGDWGADHARTRRGRMDVSKNVLRLRRQIAATQRPDVPSIETVGDMQGYRLTGSNLAVWGPMTVSRLTPILKAKHCPQGHVRELRYGRWLCMTCRRDWIRQRRQGATLQAQTVRA